MERALPELPNVDPTSSHFLGVGVAVLFIVALRLLLPPRGRYLLRQPVVFLALYFGARAIVASVGEATELGHFAALASVVLLLASIGRSGLLLTLDIVLGRRLERPLPRIVRDLSQGLVYLGVLLAALRSAGVELSSILTTSALLTAVVALSLQETLGNLVAGLAIQVQRPFDVGDWIQFDTELKHIGRVVEINWRATKVVTLDEVEVIVPNSTLAKAPITNFTKPNVRSRRSLYVYVPPSIAPHRVERAALEAVSGSPGVLDRPQPSIVNNGMVDGNVEYWIRFFTEQFDRRDLVDGAARDRIWYAFSRARIPFAAPNRFVRVSEVSSKTQQEEEQALASLRMDALRNVDFLRNLPEDRLAELAAASQLRVYGQGEVIVEQGDGSTEMFIVETGDVSVSVRQPNVHEVARLGRGSFFGEMALMTGEPRNASVVATTPCTLIGIDDKAMRGLLETTPELAEHVSRVIAERQAALSVVPEASDERASSVEERSSVLLSRIKRFFSL